MPTIDSHFGEPLSPSHVKRCARHNAKGIETTKSLVVRVDETSNEFGRTDTNVVEMFTQIDQETTLLKQRAYSGGIGTDPSSANIFSRIGRVTIDSHSGEPPSSSRVERCANCGNPGGKKITNNLVVCIDGTSNEFGRTNTNVVEMFAQIDQETTLVNQYAYYSGGIGTDPSSSNILSRIRREISNVINTAFALNVKKNVMEAYAWLAEAYKEGDQIYLFGFSRGAYQVRVLASMIHEIGLLKVSTEKQIIKAYDHYQAIHSGHRAARDMAKKFKNTFSWRGTRVHFVGVWDTVSSVGFVNGKDFLLASSSAEQACHFRHALALDECRVKFMPEYFCEVNSQTDPTISDMAGLSGSAGKEKGTADIKEVWFAGCHSDVGGKDGIWETHRAGNVSLLWMRREATKSGLVLRPTDLVWVPSDIDFGVSNSMTPPWQLLEYMPIIHQVSFSGAGGNSLCWHRRQPRRIIPGQKVHASILYANAYEPRASLGGGFAVPMEHFVPHAGLDKQFWETEFFDDTAAQELVSRLNGPQGVAVIYLNKLLFMLRFEEGKQSFRNMQNWKDQFTKIIGNQRCVPLVRLGVIVVYYEVSTYDPVMDSKPPHVEGLEKIIDDANDVFSRKLSERKGSATRALAFVRYLAKYKHLQERILTQDVLSSIMDLFDEELRRPARTGFILAIMDALTCLFQCEDTRETIIRGLGSPYTEDSRDNRLSRALKILGSQFLVGALHMMMNLAQIPEARSLCSTVKPRLRELAGKNKRRISLLSVEILLILYDPNDPGKLDMHSAHFRATIIRALVPLRADSADEKCSDGDLGRVVLRQLFGAGATKLASKQEELIRELEMAVQEGSGRTAATLTLLKLCETECIRTFLLEIDLLGVFVNQLRRKDSALLAAYALAACLKYDDMKQSIKNNELLPKNIVGMLRLDYFDDAVGRAEGFRTFRDLMQHTSLREKTREYGIVEALSKKLLQGKPTETHTSLMCLDILRSIDKNAPCTEELVEKSLRCLQKPGWKDQKTGLIILLALAQTEHGVAAISPRILEIIEMLLPQGYSSTQSTASTSAANREKPVDPREKPVVIPLTRADSTSFTLLDGPPKPASGMMGPACALWILALNKNLCDITRVTPGYNALKFLFRNGTLFDEHDTPPWRVYTPDRADVGDVLQKMFKVVDEELPVESLMSIGDVVLPDVQHWDKVGYLFLNTLASAILNSEGIVLGLGTWILFGAAAALMVAAMIAGRFWYHVGA